jgi:hypothetical protein
MPFLIGIGPGGSATRSGDNGLPGVLLLTRNLNSRFARWRTAVRSPTYRQNADPKVVFGSPQKVVYESVEQRAPPWHLLQQHSSR